MHAILDGLRNLDEFVERYRSLVLLLTLFFAIGVIFGALAVRSIADHDRAEVLRLVSGSLSAMQRPETAGSARILQQALLRNLAFLGALWVLGISVVGVFGVMLVALFRGVVSGFVVAFLASGFGLKGVGLALLVHLPHTLLEVPAIIIGGTASVAFSLQVVRSWKEGRRVPHFYPVLADYTVTLLVMGILLFAAGVVESYISPALVRYTAPLLQSF